MKKEKQKITEFNVSEIEDAKIIIKAKGKHFGLVPKGDSEDARAIRVALIQLLFSSHYVVNTSLEDLKTDKKQNQ